MPSTEQPSPEDNLKKYQSQLNKLVKNDGQSYVDAVKEGFHILAREEKAKAKIVPLPIAPKKQNPVDELTQTLTANISNPYEKARIKILVGMSPMAKKEIADMEASGNTNHRFYNNFVRMIIEEAEKSC